MDMQMVEGWISRLPGGAALVRQENKKRVQGRAERVAAIEKIKADHKLQDAPLAKREADAKAAVDVVNKQLVELGHVLTAVRRERLTAKFTAEHAVRQHEIVLRETADTARIDTFRSELRDIQDRLRGSLNAHGDTVRQGGVAEYQEIVSNVEAVKRCVAAVLAALEACDRLLIEAHEDLDAAIERIRATIPLADLEVTETFRMYLGYTLLPYDRAAEGRKNAEAWARETARAS